jgi:hypothetical protein
LRLSEVVDSLEYVQLETTNDCLLPREAVRVYKVGDYIFLVDKLIYKFDAATGKFLCIIGDRGQGPQEYSQIQRMTVLENQQKVIVRDMGKEYLTVYGYDGKYREQIPLRFTGDSLLTKCGGTLRLLDFNERYAAYYAILTPKSNSCQPLELIVYDYINGQITSSVPNRLSGDYVDYQTRIPGVMSGSMLNGGQYYKSFYMDTLYKVDAKGMTKPVAVIDLGSRKAPDDLILSRHWQALLKDKIMVQDAYENSDCILLECYRGFTPDVDYFICKYDKTTDEVSYHSTYFINDIDGGSNIYGFSYLSSGITSVRMPEEEKEEYRYIYFSNLKKSELKYPDLKDSYEAMQAKRDLDDNPLLMLIHKKK